MNARQVEARTREMATKLLRDAWMMQPSSSPADRFVEWATADERVKTQLFRLVDVFPVLHTPEQIYQHLADYLLDQSVPTPAALSWAIHVGAHLKSALARTASAQVHAMGRRFIAGEDFEQAWPELAKRYEQGVAFTIDLLGEASLSQAEADAFRHRYLQVIDEVADRVGQVHGPRQLEQDHLGVLPRGNVSIKITSIEAKLDPLDFDRTVDRLCDRLRPILDKAARRQVLLNFDMEQRSLKDLTLAVFKRCAGEVDFPAAVALQAYLKSGQEDAEGLIRWARRTGRQVTVRLVKGAYWDYEGIVAQMRGWPVPVWTRKAQTDAAYERMTEQLLAATPRETGAGGVKLAVGSHNARSIGHAMATAEAMALPQAAVEFQMLYGMAEGLKRAMVHREARLREYVPLGQMIPGMAYLVRRLLENTSNTSWLKAGFAQHRSVDELIASPHQRVEAEEGGGDVARHPLLPAVDGVDGGRPFFNEPHRDFSQASQREAFGRALGETRFEPVSVSATEAQADRALAVASKAFARWRDMDPSRRADVIATAANAMRDKRDELAAIIVRESAKTWRDADADVCEAIDFAHYYARQSVALFAGQPLGQFAGERNALTHIGKGVAAIISPWNFPLAICCGMTTAALVTGNAAIVKPAEQSPVIAKRMCELLWDAGVPPEVLHYLPGQGETVGAKLVRDARTAMICFTGSKAVGLEILRAAATAQAGQKHLKKVVCEMGGKDAIIVDESADLDEAVVGVRDSAFGYAGQRCSACSRAIVVQGAYDLFLRRLVEATKALQLGDAADPATDVPPVIDQAAAEKIRGYIEVGKQEGKLELAMTVAQTVVGGKPMVGPHIFSGIEVGDRLAEEEIFGPVLAVLRAQSFEDALAIANSSPYKLTGGVFSRTPAHLARAQREFRVGNLYLNRGITGSLVGRQPFGGFGLSGLGTKAGGGEYLQHFVVPRVSTENTLRRGFAPGYAD